jgi:hypothetical protein
VRFSLIENEERTRQALRGIKMMLGALPAERQGGKEGVTEPASAVSAAH